MTKIIRGLAERIFLVIYFLGLFKFYTMLPFSFIVSFLIVVAMAFVSGFVLTLK